MGEILEGLSGSESMACMERRVKELGRPYKLHRDVTRSKQNREPAACDGKQTSGGD